MEWTAIEFDPIVVKAFMKAAQAAAAKQARPK
jgi:hypothetical protein